MAHKVSKSKKAELKKKRAQAKIRKMENQDSKGIIRKKVKFAIDPNVFVVLKIISIVLILVCYLLFSPLLIFCIIFSATMFIFANMAENQMNHTFIKSNHIKLLKIDSIVAILVLIVTVFSFIMNLNTKKKMPFGNFGNTLIIRLEELGACQTGQRSLIHLGGLKPKFGNMDFPEGMPQMPPGGFNGKPGQKFDIKLEDLPLEAVFSQTLSTINSILIFLVPISGTATLVHYYYRKKRFDKDMNDMTEDTMNMDEELIEKIFLFGYEVDENGNLVQEEVVKLEYDETSTSDTNTLDNEDLGIKEVEL